ncbi:MAG: exo-alpha-sialidase [Saprospiraceae bacterium]|nr:exo-alpha-sialidase [Saprospiraceae bacterium]
MRLYLFPVFISLPFFCFAKNAAITVFQSGEAGYACFRIPAIVRSPEGVLLAFAEGRKTGCSDFGDVDVVLKTSKNKGKTWSQLRVVAENGHLQSGNPAPVFDLLDPRFPKGRLFLFYNSGNASEHDIRLGKGQREVHFIASSDDGSTWSPPTNITAQVHRPLPHSADWRSYANTPGHALQLPSGRLIVPANHSAGPPKDGFLDYRAFAFFSDDHGESFQIMPDIDYPGSNEATAASLPGGRFLMSIRDQSGRAKARLMAIGSKQGIWDSTWVATNLPDPVCQGSLLNFSSKKNKQVLLHSNPASTTNRCCLQVKMSRDGGKTWQPILLQPNESAAYSDLVQLSRKSAGLLAEVDEYGRVIFQRFRVKWRLNS